MEAVFDSVANQYDKEFTYTEVGKRQRERVWQLLYASHLLDKPSEVLEVNCGTGEDAIRFANLGHSVLATDISGEMISVCRQKSQYSEVDIKFIRAGLHQVSTLETEQNFDLIFSNFGGLNCISPVELSDFLADAFDLLKPSGSLVIVIMPSFCVWESLYYVSKGLFREAFRRTRSVTEAVIGNHSFPVYYYNPYKLIKMAGPYFKKVQLAPVGSFLPPSYLEKFFGNKTGLLTFLEKLEKTTGNVPALSCLSDHYYLHLIKK